MKHLTISLNSASYKKMRQLMETYFSDKVIFVYEEDEEDLENSLYEKITQDAKENFLPVDVRVKQILNLYYSGALVQENKLDNINQDADTINTLNSDYISKLEERIKQLETNISLQASVQNNMGNVSIVSSETKSITSNTTKIMQENSSVPNITHTSNTSTTCNTSEISTTNNTNNTNNINNNNDKNSISAEVINAEVINAEIINAEVVESKVINSEVLESEIVCAEVVDAEIVDAQVVNAEVVETESFEAKIIEAETIEIIDEKSIDIQDDNNNKLTPNLTTVDGFLQVASNVLFDDNIEIVSDFNF